MTKSFLSLSAANSMRICVDIQPALSQRAGIGRYTRHLVQHLGEFSGDDDLSLFCFDFNRRGIDFEAPRARLQAVRWCPGRIAQQSWKRLHWPPYNWFAGPADLYHFPNFVIPPLTRGRSIVTIHDMSFVRHPEFAESKNLRYLSATIRRTAQKADAILTDSKFSALEIQDLLGIPANRVFPIHLGVATECKPPSPDGIANTRRMMGLDRPYLLTVGTIEPRKNLPLLVEAFEQLNGFDGDLVIAGMTGWKFEPILERIKASPKSARIRLLSYVPDGQLAGLYGGAAAFAIASVYEGFGLPPLEAMACGTPVVSSCGGSLPEVLGDAALLVKEAKAPEWASALRSAVFDTAVRTRLASGGPKHAARFDWRETARQTWNVYRQVCP